MLKRLKSVSMLLFLMGASTGAAYAVANPGVAGVKITQDVYKRQSKSSPYGKLFFYILRNTIIPSFVCITGT